MNPRLTEPPPVEKAMAVAFARSEEIRKLYEDEMVRQLSQRGVTAVASYTVVPAPEADRFPDTAKLEQAARAASIPYLVTSRLTQLKARPGSSKTRDVSWPDLSVAAEQETRTVPAEGKAVIESYLYDVATKQAVWSGTTETEVPAANRQDVASKLVHLLLEDMARLELVKTIN
jgi:hypothetical protein